MSILKFQRAHIDGLIAEAQKMMNAREADPFVPVVSCPYVDVVSEGTTTIITTGC